MIPLKDSIPHLYKPWAVWFILGLNVLAFAYTVTLTPQEQWVFFQILGVVPARFLDANWADVMGYPSTGILPFFSYMFLHGGWMHFLLNMLCLWIFADNIEDVMGPGRFVVFYFLCGFIALASHMFFHMGDRIPIVGASGAIAGIMGGYFLLYPHAKVTVLIPIIFIPFFVDVPAMLFLGFWFLSQIFSGFMDTGESSIAWWAHAGGFIAGMILVHLFQKPDRCHFCFEKSRDSEQVSGQAHTTSPAGQTDSSAPSSGGPSHSQPDRSRFTLPPTRRLPARPGERPPVPRTFGKQKK